MQQETEGTNEVAQEHTVRGKNVSSQPIQPYPPTNKQIPRQDMTPFFRNKVGILHMSLFGEQQEHKAFVFGIVVVSRHFVGLTCIMPIKAFWGSPAGSKTSLNSCIGAVAPG